MRCPDCNKFASMEMGDPEVSDLEVDATGHVTCEVRIVRNCADCSTELKESSFSLECDVEIGKHSGEGHELSVEEDTVEPIEEGGGRYAKSYYGATVSVSVSCSCGKLADADGEMSDKVAASAMDELV